MKHHRALYTFSFTSMLMGGCIEQADTDVRKFEGFEAADEDDYDPLVDDEPVDQLVAAPDGAASCPPLGQNPGDWGFCSASCRCGAGQGDCDSEDQCQAGLACVEDVGGEYGWEWNLDVCEPVQCAAPSSQVPVMTSSNAPTGLVTRSGVYSGSYEGWKAFDDSPAQWISQTWQSPAWLAYEWGAGTRRIESYDILFNNGTLTSRAPKNWTLEGWDGGSWTVVDTRTNQTGWAGTETRSFTVANPGFYSKYRLHITQDNDNRADIVVISINRLVLYGC